ncbi:MAG TPA: glucosamine-6-phosphate deaminase [Thermoanaerobaculia bacterium]|nr:glucosamine-6-phosphate deaminase [Thermoanaerobaculia bacterium]
MRWETFDSYESLSAHAAELLLDAIRENPRIVLGLPTGRTPLGMYARVVSECAREYRCFRDVVTFNLDEYIGIAREHPGSYATYMREHLFAHVDLDPRNTHVPDGVTPDPAGYEQQIRDAGGLGFTFLGLGRNGHIGFNEPGTPFDSRTRIVELTESTRRANAPHFPDGDVPTHAITMGIATILESKRIVLLASSEGKREAIERLRSHDAGPAFPASALWLHSDVLVLCAANAASSSS